MCFNFAQLTINVEVCTRMTQGNIYWRFDVGFLCNSFYVVGLFTKFPRHPILFYFCNRPVRRFQIDAEKYVLRRKMKSRSPQNKKRPRLSQFVMSEKNVCSV